MASTIEGVCPVLAVPFTSNGEVDYESFASLVEWIISLGTKSVLFFGVASENIKLSDPERYALLEMLMDLRQGSQLKVIASIADHSAELAVIRARDYQSMGVDFINILPPTFFSPTAAQIKIHISKILGAVHIPAVIQHLPQAGGMQDVAELLTLVDQYPNLQIIKCEANPPSESILRVREITKDRVKTLIGWGGIFWEEGAAAGAQGIQPGCALTDLYLWAEKSLLAGDHNEFAKRLQKFLPLVSTWIQDLELLIAAEKRILQRRGIIATDYCRAPTSVISPKNHQEILEALALVELVRSNG
jgi:4-hydroxy-tetrahydrodipicolinate synthase